MAKLTQTQIKEKLEKWAATELEARKVQENIEKTTAPIVEAHEANLAAATAKLDRKLTTLVDTSAELQQEIEGWLDAQSKAVRIETERAIAQLRIETVTKTGPRVVDAQKFIEKATGQKKDPWTCIKVEVGKAEKLLGPKDIDTVSTRPENKIEIRKPVVELKG